MNKDRVLLALVAADVLLCFGTIGAELMFHWTLPASLREYAWSPMLSFRGAWDAVLFGMWSLTIGATLVAWVGLLNYWSFARPLYLSAWVTWVLLLLLSGPSVMTSVGAMVTTMESVVGGTILGLVYFSELAPSYERRPVQVPSPI